MIEAPQTLRIQAFDVAKVEGGGHYTKEKPNLQFLLLKYEYLIKLDGNISRP